MKKSDATLGWLLLLLALSKRRSGPSSPRWQVPEGPQPEDNALPQLPVLPPNPLDPRNAP